MYATAIMKNLNYLATLTTVPAIALAALGSLSSPSQASNTNTVNVTCDLQNSVPTVIATFSNQESMQITPILSFVPEYFAPEEAKLNCQSTAEKLHGFYSQDKMNYLASDTLGEKPVVCAVARRGVNCSGYNSEILFSLAQAVSPTELLYNMLGNDFKGSQPPSSRTVSRIYTDLRPTWWPFD